jgi:hypothetical protein
VVLDIIVTFSNLETKYKITMSTNAWDGTGLSQEDFMKKDEVIIVSEDDKVSKI